jgi:hypothetical protein
VGGACGTHERGEKSVQGCGVKARRKRPLGRPRRRWEDGIRMDLGEIGLGVEWIQLAQGKGRWQNLWVLAQRNYLEISAYSYRIRLATLRASYYKTACLKCKWQTTNISRCCI